MPQTESIDLAQLLTQPFQVLRVFTEVAGLDVHSRERVKVPWLLSVLDLSLSELFEVGSRLELFSADVVGVADRVIRVSFPDIKAVYAHIHTVAELVDLLLPHVDTLRLELLEARIFRVDNTL